MKWLLLTITLFSQTLYATSSVDDLSFLFYQNKLSQDKSFQTDDQCYPMPHSKSCPQVICDKLPSYMCDSSDEIKDVVAACKGNVNGACVDMIVKKLPSYQSDSLEEMKEIAGQCVNVYSSSCLDLFAAKLPAYQMDSKDEIFDILKECKGTSSEAVECATFTCGRLPSYQCDSKDEIISVLNSCGN